MALVLSPVTAMASLGTGTLDGRPFHATVPAT